MSVQAQLSVPISGTDTVIHPETEFEQIIDGSTAVNNLIKATKLFIPVPKDYYYRPSLFTSNKTSITIPAGTGVVVNDTYFEVTNDTVVSFTSALPASSRKGRDVYVYACVSNNALTFVMSMESTYPSGYTADTSRKIGGFHCLCADVGTISGHTLSGYIAGDILPASRWDLKFRAASGNEGMVFCEGINKWVDIYLSSVSGNKLVSVNGGTTADGASATAFSWMKFNLWLSRSKKHMPRQDEFMEFSLGSNQGTNVQGSSDKSTTGGYVDTAGVRMISNIGCEDCCGFLWQWGLDTGDSRRDNTSEDNSNLTDFAQVCAKTDSYKSATDTTETANSYGQHYRDPARVLLGGYWNRGVCCGSRASSWDGGSLCLYSFNGCRGLSFPASV